MLHLCLHCWWFNLWNSICLPHYAVEFVFSTCPPHLIFISGSPCDNYSCGNGGTCFLDEFQPKCACRNKFTGDNCTSKLMKYSSFIVCVDVINIAKRRQLLAILDSIVGVVNINGQSVAICFKTLIILSNHHGMIWNLDRSLFITKIQFPEKNSEHMYFHFSVFYWYMDLFCYTVNLQSEVIVFQSTLRKHYGRHHDLSTIMEG